MSRYNRFYNVSFESGKALHYSNTAWVVCTHLDSHAHVELTQAAWLSTMKIYSWTSIMCLWKRKSRCILNNCLSHLPCLSHLVSFFCVSLPPTFLCLIYTLSLSPSLSQTLSCQSQGCSVVNWSVIYSLFSYQHCWVVGGRRQRGRTRSPAQSLPGAADRSWVQLDQRCDTVGVAGPHCDLKNLGSAKKGEATRFLLGRLFSWKLSQLSLVRGLERDCNKCIPNYRIERKWKKDPINISQWNSRNLHALYLSVNGGMTVCEAIGNVRIIPITEEEGCLQWACDPRLGFWSRGPRLTLRGKPSSRRMCCCCCFGCLCTAVWDMAECGTALPLALDSAL